jgi:hypothetical protein
MSTLAQPDMSASKRPPLPMGLLIAAILVAVQVIARAGFLIYGLAVNFRSFYNVSVLILSFIIPVLLLVMTTAMVALIFARTPAAKPFGITVCILNLVYQLFTTGRIVSFYFSHPNLSVGWIFITVTVAYLTVFTLALIFLLRWRVGDAPGQYVPVTTPGMSFKGMAKASLICAICGPLLMVILGPTALGLGIAARTKMRRSNNFDGAGMALAGIIIGSIEIVVSVLAILLAIAIRS